jgi:uncharacterized membrane protein (UPF0127 family)
MRFAIDLVYLDRALRVSKTVAFLKPWRVSAALCAHSVLEVPAGSIVRAGIQVGDYLDFDPQPTFRRAGGGAL